jgi:hypothetical protein
LSRRPKIASPSRTTSRREAPPFRSPKAWLRLSKAAMLRESPHW